MTFPDGHLEAQAIGRDALLGAVFALGFLCGLIAAWWLE